jgi:hypothetical protein
MKLSNKPSRHDIHTQFYSKPIISTHPQINNQIQNNSLINHILYTMLWNDLNFNTYKSINPSQRIITNEMHNKLYETI